MSPLSINNYQFTEPLSSEKSGFSQWGIGLKGNHRYFVKRFLSPIYPEDTSMYFPEEVQNRIAECNEFVKKRKRMYEGVLRASDGNLVTVEQFFRVGAKYYISTECVEGKLMTVEEISHTLLADRIRLCCSIAHSFAQLHREHIVHADVKPDNFLVIRNPVPQAKIIDFDCSFFEDDAPDLDEELNCDLTYLTPEGYLHISGQSSNLTCKLDVFALGLIFYQYMTGTLPGFDREKYQYAYESVLDGVPLNVSGVHSPDLRALFNKMLQARPESRPDMGFVFKELRDFLLILLGRKLPASSGTNRKTQNQKPAYFIIAGDL